MMTRKIKNHSHYGNILYNDKQILGLASIVGLASNLAS